MSAVPVAAKSRWVLVVPRGKAGNTRVGAVLPSPEMGQCQGFHSLWRDLNDVRMWGRGVAVVAVLGELTQ